LIGIIQVHPQPEYGNRQRHEKVKKIINNYLMLEDIAYINLDTLYKGNILPVKNAAQFECLVSKLDVVITTRLHGMVFALKKGIPAIAIDAIAGGAKVTAQAKAIGWPIIFNGDDLNEKKIQQVVNLCLNGSMNQTIKDIRPNILAKLDKIKSEFQKGLIENLK